MLVTIANLRLNFGNLRKMIYLMLSDKFVIQYIITPFAITTQILLRGV